MTAAIATAAALFLALVKSTWALNAMTHATRHSIRAATAILALAAMWGLIGMIHGWRPDGHSAVIVVACCIRYLTDRRRGVETNQFAGWAHRNPQ